MSSTKSPPSPHTQPRKTRQLERFTQPVDRVQVSLPPYDPNSNSVPIAIISRYTPGSGSGSKSESKSESKSQSPEGFTSNKTQIFQSPLSFTERRNSNSPSQLKLQASEGISDTPHDQLFNEEFIPYKQPNSQQNHEPLFQLSSAHNIGSTLKSPHHPFIRSKKTHTLLSDYHPSPLFDIDHDSKVQISPLSRYHRLPWKELEKHVIKPTQNHNEFHNEDQIHHLPSSVLNLDQSHLAPPQLLPHQSMISTTESESPLPDIDNML